ncbi:SERTA domain-containing protein 2-like [Megalops cyprinoides]|uniref:SERTA domain-containing protein 2-like n=1 Tax=Megalops cyprinoides TaxID=118141 RepID=UPI0018644752|nr:SERTA domain-containing protein 2-like [Megalops cyprinoides]
MLGRGVKRKLSDYEEPAAVTGTVAGAVTAGGAESPAPDLPYTQQRQLVLNLCLNKLQSCHTRAEPSLHRAVLLANTLRQIQEEMRQEGGEPPVAPAPSPPPHAATPLHAPELPPVPAGCPAELQAEGAAEGGGGAPACPGCARGEGPRPSSPPDDIRSLDSLFGSFEITNSTSYLTDLAFDDIFEDIDTSMYDSSDFSVLAFPPPRAVGAAASADDGLKSFSSCTSSASSLQLCLTDLNDLDHIMEILVGS